MIWLLVGLVLVLVLAMFVVTTYNGLVRLRNKSEEAWSGIDVQLQRRADLVPNLVETVKGYASHERETFEEVTRARQAVVAANGPVEAEAADGFLVAALRRLFILAEDYPDLQAAPNFLALQRQLAVLEEDLSFSRRYYNAVVEDLNTRIETFPSVLIAGPMGFARKPYFEAGQDERTVPEVDLTPGDPLPPRGSSPPGTQPGTPPGTLPEPPPGPAPAPPSEPGTTEGGRPGGRSAPSSADDVWPDGGS